MVFPDKYPHMRIDWFPSEACLPEFGLHEFPGIQMSPC